MERLIDGHSTFDDQELSLRPAFLREYIGQDKIKAELEIYLQAAKSREETLDHVLLYGPPGLGKTTLAHIIAHEMGTNIKVVTGPSIEKTGELAAILSSLEPGDVLFIDEIHRLPKVIEEVLYSAMEDFTLDVIIGKDTATRSIQIDLPPFTLVGATTRAGDLSAPLRDRFGIPFKLDYYSDKQLGQIISRSVKVLETSIDDLSIIEIARRSRGTPRIANRLLRRVRDFGQVMNDNFINIDITQHALNQLKVDELGLDDVDIAYLRGLIERFGGGPVGLKALATAISEEVMTLEDMYEPYLVQIGFVNRTPRGRVATPKAYEHLRIAYHTTLFEEE